ncbi:hypothetical protein G7Y79_00018g045280 [Physcia stellaris]|nr:hypothetical protein G7Y79_00018g045280 [Physcia stellaris]
MTNSPTPTPMPALAPLLNPADVDADDVGEALAVDTDGLRLVDWATGTAGVLDVEAVEVEEVDVEEVDVSTAPVDVGMVYPASA